MTLTVVTCESCVALRKEIEQLQRKLKANVADVFWSKFVRAENGCLLWTGAVNKVTGYGQFNAEGQITTIHRYAYLLTHGEINGEVIRHTCDTKLCGEPTHLIVGTQQQNMQDREAHNRHLRKVTSEQIAQMQRDRDSGMSFTAVAKKHGLSTSCVWSHVA